MSDAILPPSSEDAERALLGCLLIDNGTIEGVMHLVKPGDFYNEQHGLIYEAITRLRESGRDADILTVSEELRSLARSEDIGGEGLLIELVNAVPTALNTQSYASVVLDRSARRSALAHAASIAKAAYDLASPIGVAVSTATAAMAQLTAPRDDSAVVKADAAASRMFDLINGRADRSGIPIHINALNDLIRGAVPGQLGVIAARPGMGKTAIGLNILTHLLMQHNLRCQFYSIETGIDDLATKIAAFHTGIATRTIEQGSKAGGLKPDQVDAIVKLSAAWSTKPVELIDIPSLSLGDFKGKAARFAAKHGGIDVVVIDYLQLMTIPGYKAENRVQMVGEVAQQLKQFARLNNCFVLALAQLNRGCDMRKDKRPTLSDVKDSGQIEQAADWLVGLYRDEVYDPESEFKGVAEFLVLKNRNGVVGRALAHWNGEAQKFSNLSRTRIDLDDPFVTHAPRRESFAGSSAGMSHAAFELDGDY